ncbi:hypothetical protein HW555_012859 [Spodoptera exigua]|uniref:Uncharacterized protein n=1 Tax=Spodoptera exigua TaxID=7107 RepID=A0A835L0B8_SPOEX|nr:hypothetical protein HW555_012859 [Spodoptera exigua]
MRTNNMVESWNAKIKKIIPEKPNIAQFLNGIKKDANFYFSKSNRPVDVVAGCKHVVSQVRFSYGACCMLHVQDIEKTLNKFVCYKE